MTDVHRPARVVVLTSRRAPGLDHLIERDPGYRTSYEIVGVIASDPECAERARCAEHGIPFLVHDLRAFAAERGGRWTDLILRKAYDAELLSIVEGWKGDAMACAGYLHVLTHEILRAFPRRVVNVHDGDLAITDGRGQRKYRGLHSTRDAILAGEPETRCTVHLVTAEVDGGPIIARSRAFRVHEMVADARRRGATDLLKAYAFAHREWMMHAAFGPLLARGISWVATGGSETDERARAPSSRAATPRAARRSGRRAPLAAPAAHRPG